MNDLVNLQCVACQADAPKVSDYELEDFIKQSPSWAVLDVDGEKQLERKFVFKNFVAALAFAQKVGELAEAENHHPSILVEWGRVTVTWWTHAISGLHQNDLIAAAKTGLLYN